MALFHHAGDAALRIETLQEPIQRFAAPAAGRRAVQLTAEAFLGVLKTYGIAVNASGRSQWVENVLAKRL